MVHSWEVYSFYLITAMLTGKGVLSQSVIITEDTVYIRNNDVGQVTCTLSGNCGGIVWYLSSLSTPVASAYPGYTCSNTTAGYYQTCDNKNHQYKLYFTGSTNLHGQTITCSGEGCSPQQTTTDIATISVIVPVRSVSLEGNNGQQITVKAGQPKSIICVTGTSRPAPHILWYISGTNVTSSSTESIITAASQMYYTRSTLTFTPTKSQNGLQLNCKAYNTDGYMVELTTKPTLNVQYPPDTAAIIVGQSGSESVAKGDIVTLECIVRGGNPLATIIWNCFGVIAKTFSDSNTAKSSVTFTASNTHNGGQCICSATHPAAIIASDSFVIDVEYGPTVVNYLPELKSYTLNEGDTLGPIQCVSDCNPKCKMVWTRPGQPSYTGENLTISSISRTQEGDYQCTASNKYGSITGQRISVIVYYGPGRVTLNPSSTSLVINETYQLGPKKCSADCKPTCTYKWIRPNQSDIHGDILLVDSIQRTQAGTYICQAYNVVSTETSSDVIVTVHFAAKITSMTISGGNNFSIDELSTETISCLAEGLPKPNITLRYISNNTILNSVDGDRLDFRFPSARCYDTGTYQCHAVNKFTPQKALQKDVFVLCKPRTEQKPLPNKYAYSVGETLNIAIPYLAYPRPTFYWFKNIPNGSSTEILDGHQNAEINNTAVNTYIFVTELIRKNVKKSDFGTYIIRAKNVIGSSENVYIVRAKGKPDQPFSGLATCIGYNSAVITWSSGFNNGDVQTFSVIYKEVGGTKQTLVSGIRDPGPNKPLSHTFFPLRDSTTYAFNIYSSNSFGDSSLLEVNCSTSVKYDEECVNSYNGISIGIIVGLIVGITISSFVLVIFLWRKGQLNNMKCKSGNETNDTEKQQTYDDTKTDKEETNVYEGINQEGADNIQEFASIQAEYEHLRDGPESSTYKNLDFKETGDIQMTSIYVNTTVK